MSSINDLIEQIWNCPYKEFLTYQQDAFNLRINKFGKNLYCYSPSMIYYGIDQYYKQNRNKFVSISVTGTSCALKCDHCNGKLLESMHSAKESRELLSIAEQNKLKGCENLLISGGSTKNGNVPLWDHMDALKEITEKLKMKIFLHTGLPNEELINLLSEIKIESVMFDVIGDDETIKEIYHLDKTIADFDHALQLLKTKRIPFTPHIILGLNYGVLKGEFKALKMIAQSNPNALVLVILKPFEGSRMESVTPLSIENVSRFFVISRLSLPKTPITLGCARPIGDYRVGSDLQAIDSGLNGIAFLSQEAADYAEDKGLQLHFNDTCCAEIYTRMNNF
ncbi:MAG: radical SAM protein [Candidatus Lokiarchaeota archaeon]|nr:radical SAM protein [Candidatus Lokiarchaeota archaeon]